MSCNGVHLKWSKHEKHIFGFMHACIWANWVVLLPQMEILLLNKGNDNQILLLIKGNDNQPIDENKRLSATN